MNKYKKQELQVAKKYGGRRQPNSGALDPLSLKDDIRVQGEMRIELKTCKKSHTVKAESLETLYLHALRSDEMPVYMISFPQRTYVLITEDDFQEMYNRGKHQ